ncbi:sugar phosphate isomerase/epimerase [Gemmatimonas aurantiaca]|uniref:sugar phosphate isomerase/epimerase family protein n=1 Tax=Gemmatimonas aurantiaca TaxID=173480 RepID=UPI00301CABF7
MNEPKHEHGHEHEHASIVSRRAALRLLAGGLAGGAGASLWPSLAAATGAGVTPSRARIERIGLQLYTVRSLLAKDLEGTIAAVARAGITELEFAGYYDKDAAWWRALLGRHGLTAPATHEALPATDEGWGAIFDRANAMGHRLVVVPSVTAEYRGSRANWQRLAERLNTGGARAKAAGLSLAYHNHDYEFTPIDGTTGYEVMTTQTDPNAVKLELDIYWAVKAGQDPLAIIGRWPGRVVACHMKDAGPPPERRMTDVGAGTIDFRSILAKGRNSGLSHWFIEHDNPTDPIASITASAAALKAL